MLNYTIIKQRVFKRLGLVLTCVIAISLASCSNDLFTEFDGFYQPSTFSGLSIQNDTISSNSTVMYKNKLSLDLQKDYSKRVPKKDIKIMDEILFRVFSNIRINNGRLTIAHVNHESLNMDKDIFDAFKLLIENTPFKDDLAKYKAPMTKGRNVVEEVLIWYTRIYLATNHPGVAASGDELFFYLAFSYLQTLSQFSADCFGRWWHEGGDWEISTEHFTPIAAVTPNSGYQNGQYQDGLYKKTVNYYDIDAYRFALGEARVFFNEQGTPVGLSDDYDFNSGDRELIAEAVTRLTNIIGALYNHGKDYTITYGQRF